MKSSTTPILLLILAITNVFADQVSIIRSGGGTFSSSNREPKYKIEFHPEDSPFLPDDEQESIIMPNSNGQNHLCFLPKMEKIMPGKSVSQRNTSNMIIETEKQKVKTPDELLEVLTDQCFLRHDGWWSYELCYQSTFRQFHWEYEKAIQEFVLGQYDAEATDGFNRNLSDASLLKDPRSKDAAQRYHAHLYTNGTLCDLTNQPRETEVRFVCSESRGTRISSITEISTCKYAITVQCPILCKHPLFQQERPVWRVINCNVMREADKETSPKEGRIKDNNQIIMKYESNYDIEEHAT